VFLSSAETVKKEPNWLGKEFELAAHKHAIDETGGSHGVRDETLLEKDAAIIASVNGMIDIG
jgi:hypothetical protein